MRYSDFCEDIDKVFTTKNIDKDPLATVNKIVYETTLPARRRYLVKLNFKYKIRIYPKMKQEISDYC